MKKFLLFVAIVVLFSSCRLFAFLHGKEKDGCPLAHNNIGAEKILANDPKALKAAKKASRKADKGLFN